MNVANLPHYLLAHARDNVVVVFDDGDRYPASALDLRGKNEYGEFEIYVAFQDCIGRCEARAMALERGSPERFPGSWWTSVPPREPIAMTYNLERIASIQDEDRGYCVYERE